LLDSQEDFACIPLDVWLTPKKLIAYDLDSTLIEEETIDECARALNITQPGTFETISKLTEQAMTEGCDFATSFKRRVLALQGLTEDQLDQVYRSLKLKPGVLKMLQFLKTASTATNSNGSNDPNAAIKTVLISGGMSWFTDRFKKDLGLDAAFGNTVEIQHHQLTGHVSSLPIDQEGKAKTLKNLAQSFHIKPSEIIAIGDGANDLAMIQYAGIGIAKQAKPKLKQSAQVVIEQSHFDFISDLARF
jgi:phosphoserine phosphatase